MFLTSLKLEALSNRPGWWVLLDDLIWKEGASYIIVPAGFMTDLASVPPPFRNVLNINGRSRSPAVLHDYAYRAGHRSRQGADDLFRRALEAEGMGFMRHVYWAGVRLGGWLAWSKHREREI
jgi:hypothetical protein